MIGFFPSRSYPIILIEWKRIFCFVRRNKRRLGTNRSFHYTHISQSLKLIVITVVLETNGNGWRERRARSTCLAASCVSQAYNIAHMLFLCYRFNHQFFILVGYSTPWLNSCGFHSKLFLEHSFLQRLMSLCWRHHLHFLLLCSLLTVCLVHDRHANWQFN